MFETATAGTTEAVGALVAALSGVEDEVSDAERVTHIAALERLKALCAAAQARITADFVDSQEQVAAACRERARVCAEASDFDGWREARELAGRATWSTPDHPGDASGGARGGRSQRRASSRRPRVVGVAGQVALARRESPHQGAGHVGMALALVHDMPRLLGLLESGRLSEWRAQLVVRETAVLDHEQRRAVDAELAHRFADELEWWGDRELVRVVRAITYRLDAKSVAARCRLAQQQRRVSTRPAPDTMAYVTALLPVAQGVAVYAALTAAADTARAAGDDRGKGQVMADTFVARLTGQEQAHRVPVEVQVVMTDRALLAGDATPAHVPGYGSVPAAWARELVTPRADGEDRPRSSSPSSSGPSREVERARVWVRRLYTHPADGTLVAMDSTRRVFDGGLRRFLLARDAGTCRTPWCDAPARHLDHVRDHARGGPTTADNGQGLCVRCNLTKQQPGWRARVVLPGLDDRHPERHEVEVTTPTGHTYRSQAPPVLPGLRSDDESVLERHLVRRLAAA